MKKILLIALVCAFMCASCSNSSTVEDTTTPTLTEVTTISEVSVETSATLNNVITGDVTTTEAPKTTEMPVFFTTEDVVKDPPKELTEEEAVAIYTQVAEAHDMKDWEAISKYGALDVLVWLKTGKQLEGNQLVAKAEETLSQANMVYGDKVDIKATKLRPEYCEELTNSLKRLSAEQIGVVSPYVFSDGYVISIEAKDNSFAIVDSWKVICVNGEWKCDLGVGSIINAFTSFEDSLTEGVTIGASSGDEIDIPMVNEQDFASGGSESSSVGTEVQYPSVSNE